MSYEVLQTMHEATLASNNRRPGTNVPKWQEWSPEAQLEADHLATQGSRPAVFPFTGCKKVGED